MTETQLLEVIRTTRKVGLGTEGDPVHKHIEYYTTDGEQLAEECGMDMSCSYLLTREVNTDL